MAWREILYVGRYTFVDDYGPNKQRALLGYCNSINHPKILGRPDTVRIMIQYSGLCVFPTGEGTRLCYLMSMDWGGTVPSVFTQYGSRKIM